MRLRFVRGLGGYVLRCGLTVGIERIVGDNDERMGL